MTTKTITLFALWQNKIQGKKTKIAITFFFLIFLFPFSSSSLCSLFHTSLSSSCLLAAAMDVACRSSKPRSYLDLFTSLPWIFDLIIGHHGSSRSIFAADEDDVIIVSQIYPHRNVFSTASDAEQLNSKLPMSTSSSFRRCFAKQVALRSQSTPSWRFTTCTKAEDLREISLMVARSRSVIIFSSFTFFSDLECDFCDFFCELVFRLAAACNGDFQIIFSGYWPVTWWLLISA